MKTLTLRKKNRIYLLVFLFISGISCKPALAQDHKFPSHKKEEKKTMHIKVITKDDDGNIEKIDTVYRYGSSKGDSVIIKELGSKMDMEELVDHLKEMNISLDLEMDSLDSLAKEITATINMDDFPFHKGFGPHAFLWKDDENDRESIPGLDPDDWNDWKDCMKHQPGEYNYQYQPDNQGWMQGFTPWGKIRDIKVKDKKHGKKIVIRTEDMDYFSYMIPPQPPVPPAHPIPLSPPKSKKVVKKIIIDKDDEKVGN